ncbi:flagellar assembly peptidoglycan hydrolase FlgJ [Shewanella donghaensis]|uniref:flagellar assembly peptidoglycan hydrolase FlgJ n=1 Tax=Shewanella donghaensis TaxID=238836 RepID=UPI00118376ED|nr:flagellar assembly peptidoglycan hydrolase FlgJ [Shewanella donghaensis]
MEKLSSASNFLDLGGLDQLRSQSQKDEKAALKEVAKQFEGIFIQMLMKSMRDANEAFKSDSPLNSETTAFFENMRDQQMSLNLSDKGMLGIADMMVQQLSPEDSNYKPASVLRGNIDSRIGHQLFDDKSTSLPHGSINPITTTTADKPVIDINQLSTSHSVIDTQKLDQLLAGQAVNPVTASGNALPQSVAKSPNQFESPQHFVTVLYPHAEKAAKKLGTTPEVLLAQSALETGWGQKIIRRNDGTASNNLFNIKADKRWDGDKTSVSTLEFEKGVAVKQKADFRMYDNIEQSFDDFVSFISNGERYQDAKKVAAEPAKFINALQKAGYATDPQYANKVLKVMESVTNGLKSVLPGETN